MIMASAQTQTPPLSPAGASAEGEKAKAEPKLIVTAKAAAKVREQIAQRAKSGAVSGIRVGVKGGGCSGLSYVIEFCDEPRAKDRLFEVDGARVYVDPKSLIYLNGTTLDFMETFQQKGFKFINPQVRSECGCGESFSI
jgi:iron-sulfur cluster assembly protein